MKRGDIVLIAAPGDLGKPRPGVVVQADELGDTTTTVLVAPMSSEVSHPGRLRPVVEPTVESGLRLRSQIMCDKITALRRDRIRDTIGALDVAACERLNSALLIVFGLAR